uniref:HEAT repeat domain-containing protein n=1 Tax=Zooxanthella nutricula TaxID=1333877 RepID=A0A7S2I6J7_9DINO
MAAGSPLAVCMIAVISVGCLGFQLSPPKEWKHAMRQAWDAAGRYDAVEALAEALRTEKDWNVRVQVAKALGKFGNRYDAVEALAEALEKDPHEKVRIEVAQAFGNFDKNDDAIHAIMALEKALKDDIKDDIVRNHAESALVRLRQIVPLCNIM